MLDANGGQLGYQQTDFKTIPASRWRGLFDFRNHLRLYVEQERQATAVAEIGVCIAEEVLGGDIFERLWKSESQRTLRIQLPGVSQEENYLAAARARVPWEITRPRPDQPTLGERNLQVRVTHDTKASTSQPGQIFLAAPDVDRDLFLNLARLYPEHAERTTLYASDADLPVHLSSKLHDAPRAGYYAPYTVAPGVDTVIVPNFDIDLLGHSFFAQAEALLHDMYDLIRHGAPPNVRQRISNTPTVVEGSSFWKMKR